MEINVMQLQTHSFWADITFKSAAYIAEPLPLLANQDTSS